MKTKKSMLYVSLAAVLGLISACGAVKDKVAEVENGINVQGHWLMTQSQHSNLIEKALEGESMVLTFKDGEAAFSPTDSLKGRAAYALLSNCEAGPRPYRMEKDQIVFAAVVGCEEKRSTIQTLDGNTFKCTDLDNKDIVRTFVRISDAKYQDLVKQSDRKL